MFVERAFSNNGLESEAASLSAVHDRKMRSTAGKEICSTCLFKACIAAIPLEKAKHPLPTRSLRSLRAAAPSTSSTFWLDHAHPYVAAEEKRQVSCREAEDLVTELWSPRIVTTY